MKKGENVSVEMFCDFRDMVAGEFEEVRKKFKQVDKRFEQVDQRFEKVEKSLARLEENDRQIKDTLEKQTSILIKLDQERYAAIARDDRQQEEIDLIKKELKLAS